MAALCDMLLEMYYYIRMNVKYVADGRIRLMEQLNLLG